MDAVGVESRFKAMAMPKRAPNPKATAAKQAAKAKAGPPVAPVAVEPPVVPKPKAPATRVRSKGKWEGRHFEMKIGFEALEPCGSSKWCYCWICFFYQIYH